MEEKWIKICEIDYSPNDLSKMYHEEKIYDKKINDNRKKLEELVKDNILVKELRKNSIPYKCEWEERNVNEKYSRYYFKRTTIKHYFILIYIPETYKSIYEKISYHKSEKEIKEYDNTDDDNLVFEPIEKAKKVFKVLVKIFLLIALVSIIYAMIKSIFNN